MSMGVNEFQWTNNLQKKAGISIWFSTNLIFNGGQLNLIQSGIQKKACISPCFSMDLTCNSFEPKLPLEPKWLQPKWLEPKWLGRPHVHQQRGSLLFSQPMRTTDASTVSLGHLALGRRVTWAISGRESSHARCKPPTPCRLEKTTTRTAYGKHMWQDMGLELLGMHWELWSPALRRCMVWVISDRESSLVSCGSLTERGTGQVHCVSHPWSRIVTNSRLAT